MEARSKNATFNLVAFFYLEAWKVASEEMYKAQAEEQGGAAGPEAVAEQSEAETDNVEDVDFEEVK